MNKDTLVVALSDMHTGSTTALFPDRFITFPDGSNHTPNSKQKRIHAHFIECAENVKEARKGKRLVIVHNGDATEGNHHNSQQIRPMEKSDQINVHIELMILFKKIIDFHRGDELYYTLGTETHTENSEHEIGKHLGAVQANDGLYVFNELQKEINGKMFWFTHQGPSRGKGANRGNGIRNWLKHLFIDLTAENIKPPHYVVSSHFHDPDWGGYIGRDNGKYHKMELIITASWQNKTRYGYDVAPFVLNKVGLHHITVAKGGEIGDPVELLMV